MDSFDNAAPRYSGHCHAAPFFLSMAVLDCVASGVSSGGAVSAALRLSAEVENATIVCIICDRGDRYLSTGKLHSSSPQKPVSMRCPLQDVSQKRSTGCWWDDLCGR